jgi:hypothetical protein
MKAAERSAMDMSDRLKRSSWTLCRWKEPLWPPPREPFNPKLVSPTRARTCSGDVTSAPRWIGETLLKFVWTGMRSVGVRTSRTKKPSVSSADAISTEVPIESNNTILGKDGGPR